MRLGSRGFTLVEVMVASGLFGIVLMGPLVLTSWNWGALSDTKHRAQGSSILHEIAALLSVSGQCQVNFGGIELDASPQSVNGNVIADQGGSTIFQLGTARTGEKVVVSSVTVTGMSPFSASLPVSGTTELKVGLLYPDLQTSTFSLPMYVEVDGANAVTKCFLGNWQKPVWTASGTSLTYIGNVGIGTPAKPSEALSVNGSAQFNGGLDITQPGNSIDIHGENINGHMALMSGSHVFWIEYEDRTGRDYARWGGAFNLLADGLNTISFLKLETADALKTWSFKIARNIGNSGDQINNGVRLSASSASQALVFRSTLTVGDTNPGYDFYVDGGAGGDTAFAVTSDRRLKSSIRDLPGTMEALREIQGVRFRMRGTKKESIGFVAQDLARGLPDVFQSIVDRNASFWSIRYSELIPLLAKALQELTEKNRTISLEKARLIDTLCRKYPMEEICRAGDR